MKEHPILFSSPMVRAILEGHKTQTRRVIKGVDGNDRFVDKWIYSKALFTDNILNLVSRKPHDFLVKCPYGLEGDRLWVRETWAHDEPNCDDIHCGNPDHIWYHANETKIVADSFAGKARWRPSIHMPRWASRINLEILKIRVERLQDITKEDISAEGIKRTAGGEWLAPLAGVPDYPWDYAHEAYAALWNDLNDKRGYGWDVNPFVWIIEFERVKL